MASTRAMSEAEIAQHVQPNPRRGGVAEYLMVGTGIEVWVIIGYLHAVGDDVNRVAQDYALSPEAVQAALAHYRRHQRAIDDRIAQNAA